MGGEWCLRRIGADFKPDWLETGGFGRYTGEMLKLILVLINIAVLTLLATLGIFVLLGGVAVVAGVMIFLLIRRKITGRPVSFVHVYRAEYPARREAMPAIEADFHEVVDKR